MTQAVNDETKRAARRELRCRNHRDQLAAFDQQPATARIPGRVLDLLVGKSTPTRWRWIKAGRLPAPGNDGSFSVGEVRLALARLAEARDPAQRRSLRARSAA